MQEFDLFVPTSWFVDGLEIVPREPQRKAHHAKRRDARWNVAFAASVLSIGVTFYAESLAFDPRQSSVVFSDFGHVAQAPRSSSGTLHDDHSFASLFESYKAGHSLLASDRMRQIARLAVEAKPTQDIDAWAERLANDIAKADD